MSYKEKPILKLYKYENNTFVLKAIIDDYMECSFERNLYQAGNFTISINYNIPNAQLFQRGLFVQFGDDSYDFGEIISISDAISSDGKGSQIRTITGYDARYILKRRVIKNMNSNGLWVMTGKGETVLRNLIADQCGAGAEAKRQLPIVNSIPSPANAIGKEYSVSEQFSNLYEVCKTIATQSEIGWRLKFDNSSLTLTLECYEGENRAQTVQFSTSFDSLADGQFTDSSDSYTNAIYVGGKGQNDDRDIYEGEDGAPEGLDRYESWDNQSNMTTEDEYEAEALAMLTQYGQTITVSGNSLAKCPYVYKKEYDVGDTITLAFSGKFAMVQILSVTEHWAFGQYSINFSFGKPQNNIQDQLQLILRKIQTASEKSESTDSVRWYTIPDDSQMPKADVTYRTIGFIGNVGSGATFQLYLDNEKTGAKTYHIYFKQLAGAGKLTLTTGKEGASNLILNAGTYVAIVYVDENGNITSQGMTATSAIEAGNNQPVTSSGVAQAISQIPSITVDSELSLTSENPVQNKVITGALNGKQNTLTAGNNIQINGNTISATDTTYSDATQSSAGLMSASDKTKLDGIESGAQVNSVTGVKGNSETDYRTGNVNITKENIGLGNVDNTSDADKPVSTAQSTAISTAETNAKDLANATGTLAIAHGGTGVATQADINKNFIANLSSGYSDVTDGTEFVSSYASDNGFSDTNAVNKPYKRTFLKVWNYIEGKISSILGLTSTNYGGKASTAGTADNATNVNILTSSSNADYPLLFSSGVTAGNKKIYTDTANEISYNPSTNEMKVSGNVLGSNLPYFGSVYSAGTYNSGYYLLVQLEGTSANNHDISFAGVVYDNPAGIPNKTEFYIYARGNAQTISISKFYANGTSPLFATYEAVATNKFILRLYGKITGYWHRYNTVVEYASTGDVSSRVSNRTVTFPNTKVTSFTGTQITKENMLTKSDVGLGNVDNTSDSVKSVNYAMSAGSATSANKIEAANYVNNISINWRGNLADYYTTTSYQTAGNEALVFATKNAVTSFMFVNGEDSVTNHDSNRWQSLTPALQIKNNCVSIGELIANGVTPTYKLNVNGRIHGTVNLVAPSSPEVGDIWIS